MRVIFSIPLGMIAPLGKFDREDKRGERCVVVQQIRTLDYHLVLAVLVLLVLLVLVAATTV